MILALLLFLFTLVLVIWQPKGLSIGWSASIGAVLALLFGVVNLSNVLEVIGIVWDATFAFVAIILISMTIDEIGLFTWAALHMARLGGGNRRRMFLWMTLLGTLVAAFFANDGAALILTPIVLAKVRALGFNRREMLPFIMAGGFIADTTSLPLVVSNLVNIVSADFFHIGFVTYASRMVIPDIASYLFSIAALYLYFRRDLPPSYDVRQVPEPRTAIQDPRLFRWSFAVLAMLFVGYLASEAAHIPVSIVAAAAAALLLGAARISQSPAVHVGKILRRAPWSIVVFSIGMYVVVFGLRNAGFTSGLTGALTGLGREGTLPAAVGMGFIAAALSSVMNNMPTVMFDALAIHAAHATASMKAVLAYANVVGCDLGPKFTPIGSLATLLWLHVLRQKDVKIGWGYYMKTGVLLTVPTLLGTLAALALTLHTAG